MRILILLSLSLLTGCGRSGSERMQPAESSEPLLLDRIDSHAPTACVFAADYGSKPLLYVRHDRNRAVGEIQLVGKPPAVLTGTAVGSASNLPDGVQLEGRDLTASVTPASLPGVPVGVRGVRRPAVLTAATSDGATIVVEGDWSCSG